MKRPDFNEKTKVIVVGKDYASYGECGTVVELAVTFPGSNQLIPTSNKEAIKQAYLDGLESRMIWYAKVKFKESDELCWFKATELEPVQKKFIDIDYIRENDNEIGVKEDGTKAIRPANVGAFAVNDRIQITTKIDGANASIAWNPIYKKLEVFSRTNLLDGADGLRGFVSYIRTQVEPKIDFSKYPRLVFFGEWLVPHTVKYNPDAYGKWYVYDIWNKDGNCYMPQYTVEEFCKKNGLNYVEVLYDGPFISWDHCRSFIGKSKVYGPQQEGVVVKNQTKIYRDDIRFPKYIKIVDEKFKEAMHSTKEKKPVDPAVEAAKAEAANLAASIVTEARVRKLILKMVDEGKLPAELQPKDMGAVMKLLPKLVFDDVLKEEPETVKQIGEYAGKCIAAEAAKHARKIVIGS